MRITFVSDVHGHFDALSALPRTDLLIVGGDFTQFGSLEDFRGAVARFESVIPDFLAVAGNLDVPEGDAVLAETGHLLSPEAIVKRAGLAFLGISGATISPFNTPYEWKEEDMAPRLNAYGLRSFDILVSHTPPFDSGADKISSGMSVGSKEVAALMLRVRPSVVLCGHIHEAQGIYSLDGIPVVNPGPFGDKGNYAEIQMTSGSFGSAVLKTCYR